MVVNLTLGPVISAVWFLGQISKTICELPPVKGALNVIRKQLITSVTLCHYWTNSKSSQSNKII